ncbi:MAG TPA: hypothetical protein VLB76_23065 [Thermoanaerobaculia bacterium]|jgi:hypothetical protein|nr:hypothetical protein [Thermoanaerobaculia bacterium]
MSADPVRRKRHWKSTSDPKLDKKGRLVGFHPESTPEQQALLSKFGFRQATFKRRFLPVMIVWILVISFLVGIWWLHENHVPQDFATAIAAMCAFVFGYFQWRSSRYDKAMEDFYSRLNLANKRRESNKLVSRLLGHPWRSRRVAESPSALGGYDDHRWSMYVYAELDNLEYVVEKYNLGYMESRHALRGLRTFYQRCLCGHFRDRAWKCVLFMAYNDSTIEVVEKVCQHIEDQRSVPREPQSPGPEIVRRESIYWTDKAAL